MDTTRIKSNGVLIARYFGANCVQLFNENDYTVVVDVALPPHRPECFGSGRRKILPSCGIFFDEVNPSEVSIVSVEKYAEPVDDELEAEYNLGSIFGEVKEDLSWYDGPLLAAETHKLEELRAALDVVIEYRRKHPERLLNRDGSEE